jgi:hypothetical protein
LPIQYARAEPADLDYGKGTGEHEVVKDAGG